MNEKNEKGGGWKTISGRRVFIEDGESLSEAMERSGKFTKSKKSIDVRELKESENLSYKDDPYYKHLENQLKELDRKDEELHKNEPKENQYDYSKPVLGISDEEWGELSKAEKEIFIALDREESPHDKWLEEIMQIDERKNDILTKMKEIQIRAFEKEGGNTFENKLPSKAKDKEYDGFSKDTKTYKQDYLEDPKYAKSKGYSEVYIAEMSPKEYLERCSQEIFQIPLEDTYAGVRDKSSIDEYAKMMRSGVKFDMPYLDAKTRQQEGRHRALAAEKLGISKIPVLYLK